MSLWGFLIDLNQYLYKADAEEVRERVYYMQQVLYNVLFSVTMVFSVPLLLLSLYSYQWMAFALLVGATSLILRLLDANLLQRFILTPKFMESYSPSTVTQVGEEARDYPSILGQLVSSGAPNDGAFRMTNARIALSTKEGLVSLQQTSTGYLWGYVEEQPVEQVGVRSIFTVHWKRDGAKGVVISLRCEGTKRFVGLARPTVGGVLERRMTGTFSLSDLVEATSQDYPSRKGSEHCHFLLYPSTSPDGKATVKVYNLGAQRYLYVQSSWMSGTSVGSTSEMDKATDFELVRLPNGLASEASESAATPRKRAVSSGSQGQLAAPPSPAPQSEYVSEPQPPLPDSEEPKSGEAKKEE